MTKKSTRYKTLWCAPEYKRMIKTQAAQKGMSIFDYTQEVALKKGLFKLDNEKHEKDTFKFKL